MAPMAPRWWTAVLAGLLALAALCHCHLEDVLTYDLMEEVPTGTRIADILTDSGLAEQHPPEVLKELHFRFLSHSQANISIASSGMLYTSGRVDREDICPRRNICEVQLDIAVQPVTYFQIIKVAITILDINDNQPVFAEPTFTLSILESASLESAFVLPTAVDNDSPGFGIHRYDLVPDSTRSKFDLKVTPKLDGSLDVRLVLKKRLDRETREQYNLQLVAYDGGLSPMSGALDIRINVLDSNDNDPVFSETSYEVSVLENTSPGTMIVQVQASDRDDGANGQVVYGFTSPTETNHGHLFGIDGNNGEVYVKGAIDHEVASIYHLIVTAQDLGPDSLPADTTVVIHVQDMNDNAPEITINTLTAASTDKAEVGEDSPLGTFLAHISVKDPDGGLNGLFNCSINDQNFTLEQMYPTEYQIFTSVHLDRETMPEYDIALLCKDLGDQPQISIKHLKVKVTDVNDCSPEFSSQLYTGSIIERNFIGAFVLQVNATDKDTGDNAKISYSLSGEDSAAFEINSQGRVYAKKAMDREQQDGYVFSALAVDGGQPALTSSALIEISVEDVNDEGPAFTQQSYAFSVSENRDKGVRIGSLAAVDKDSPPLNNCQFSLISSRAPQTHFELDPKSGVIRTKSRLDRELQSVHHLVAKVSDTHEPSMSSTASITIYIRDENDNAPEFLFPSRLNDSVHISNMLPPGHTVANISATDRDFGDNALVTYAIKSTGNADNIFAISSANGTITVNKQLSDMKYKVFTLEIVAKDRGVPAQSSTASLSIVVNKAIPFKHIDKSPATTVNKIGHNFILVISLSCGCALITVVLVVAIIVLRRKDRNKREHKYNCRMEALRMLTAKETLCHSEEATPCKSRGAGHVNGKVNNGHSVLQYEKVPKEEPGHSPQRSAAATARRPPKAVSYSGMHPPPEATSSSSSTAQAHKRPWVLSHKEMEVHQLLGSLPGHGHHGDQDDPGEEGDSVHSGDDSNTDSGKGPSEDGEKGHRVNSHVTPRQSAVLQNMPSQGSQVSQHQHQERPNVHQGHIKGQGHSNLPPPQPPPRSCLRSNPPSHSYSQTPTKLQSFGPRLHDDIDSPPGSKCDTLSEDTEPVWKPMRPADQQTLGRHGDDYHSNYGSYKPCASNQSTLRSQRTNPRANSSHVTNSSLGRGEASREEVTSGVIV